MRLAVLADIHGNLIALDAVLAEIRAEAIAGSVCLGDVCGLGSQPREVLERLRALACPVVMGNADEFLLDPSLVDTDPHPGKDQRTRRLREMERWTAAQLTPDDRSYVQTFQPTVELPLGEDASLLCYHGSPRSSWDEIRAATPEVELVRLLGYRRALVMAGGHTHEQFVRRLDQTLVINPGSVGLAYETLAGGRYRNPPWAEYAVITAEGDRLAVELRRVPIDQAAIREALLASGMPHAAWWAADWR
jgi:predicted phosphodiesterase